MSTYHNVDNPLSINSLDAPAYLREYLRYLTHIKSVTSDTVETYYVHIRMFLRFLKCFDEGGEITKERISDLPIDDIPFEAVARVTTEDIYEFLAFSGDVLKNTGRSRCGRLVALKSFFHYLTKIKQLISEDPAEDIVRPKCEKRVSQYLSLEESYQLLDFIHSSNANKDNASRDYCMILFLLSCGMRISELVGINFNDISNDALRLYGKGRKERIVYLNDNCLDALAVYQRERLNYNKVVDKDALFISCLQGKRLTVRRVEQIIDKALKDAGLYRPGLSPHKLRHTAATIMRQSEAADLLELKAILGHADINTTELYTHVENDAIRKSMKNSPFALRQG